MATNNNNISEPENRYNISKTAKDILAAFGAESHDYRDYDAYMEALAPSTAKKFSDDGTPSYWIGQIIDNRVPTNLDAASLLIWEYFYVYMSNRVRGIAASVDDVQDKVRDFDKKINDLENKLDKVIGNQSDLNTLITKFENDLNSKLDANLKSIDDHTTSEASRVISQFP